MARKDKKYIMIHCLDTPPSWGAHRTAEEKMQEVRRWHVEERGWSDVAYAKLIDRTGETANGRDLDGDGDVYEETGAGARGWNKNTIHIALVGGKGSSANDKFEDHYTPEQDRALRAEIAAIQREFGGKLIVKGHNEVAAKACPGFQVGPWYANKPPRSIVSSKTVQGVAASGVGAFGTAATALSRLDPTTQLVVVAFVAVALLGAGWALRARLQDWANGRR